MQKSVTNNRSHSRRHKLWLIIIVELELIFMLLMSVQAYSLSEVHTAAAMNDSAATVEIAGLSPAVSLSAALNTEAAKAGYEEEHRWKGPVLSKSRGTITGPSGKETYYNLNMSGVVKIMRRMGNDDEYWVREDGVKMLGDYVMVAANLNLRPRGSLVETSLGTAIVCDTGGFASHNPTQIDVAVSW